MGYEICEISREEAFKIQHDYGITKRGFAVEPIGPVGRGAYRAPYDCALGGVWAIDRVTGSYLCCGTPAGPRVFLLYLFHHDGESYVYRTKPRSNYILQLQFSTSGQNILSAEEEMKEALTMFGDFGTGMFGDQFEIEKQEID